MNTLEMLLPAPQSVSVGEGYFKLSVENMKSIVSSNLQADKAIQHKLSSLGVSQVSTFDANEYFVVISSSPIEVIKGNKIPKVPNHAQAYALKIESDFIALKGYDLEGLFWGLVTLKHILHATSKIPACLIEDWPEIEIRGHFDDVSRSRISTVNDFKNIIRHLSDLKINYYGIYIEDVLHLESYPDIGQKRGKIMPWEIQELVDEAELHKVNLIPFFQLIGHCENLLSMENYKHLGRKVYQRMSSLDVDNPEVRDFLTKCIQEVSTLFPGKFFGMGFDETQGISFESYVRHANWCASELMKYGKKSILWADMFYKSFGIDKMCELSPDIIPVNWNYDAIGNNVRHHDELEASGKKIWGFGGYNNWACHLPNFEHSKDHIDCWTSRIKKGEGMGLFYSQWGDYGYENNRDLSWNLFAYAGECSWRGNSDKRISFENRFQHTFFGKQLPAMKNITLNISKELKIDLKLYWQMHRKNFHSLLRHAIAQPEMLKFYENDLTILSTYLDEMYAEHARMTDVSIIGQHMITALEITLLTVKRMLYAYDIVSKGVISLKKEQLTDILYEIRRVRDLYIKDWIINNKLEGIFVSVDVFDTIAASYEEAYSFKEKSRKGYKMLPIDAFSNQCMLDIAGAPIGYKLCASVPFEFAGWAKTHLELKDDKAICINFSSTAIKDLHLIASSPMTKGAIPKPSLEVSFLKDGKVVHTEVLDSVTHLVDWWAPFGEHIWAGGGYAYADKVRVIPAINPDQDYGLMKISGFYPKTEADSICLKSIGDNTTQIFAITIEVNETI